MRTKNTLKSFIYGAFFTAIIAILGLVKTKILLQCLGDEYVGIYQLFYQIYLYISLVDGGLCAAVTYQLYKPVNENNYEEINSILSGAKKYFNRIGLFVIILGLLLSIEIMFFIKETTINVMYIRVCFILYIISSAVSYFTYSHQILYEAEQKLYKTSNFDQILSILESVSAIIIAKLGGKLLTILISFVLLSVLKNIILVVISRKEHKFLKKSENINMSFKKDANSLIINKVNNLIIENSSVIIISKYLGLTAIVIYNAYNQILTMIKLLIMRFNSALVPSVGNLLVAEKEKSKKIFYELNSLLFYLGSIISVPLFFMITPFINLWYGKDYTSNNIICFLFVCLLYIQIVKIPLDTFIKASGEFKKIKNCSVYQSIVCVVLSLLLVKKMGMSGVLIATLFALITGTFIHFPQIIFKKIINDKVLNYYILWIKYLIGMLINVTIVYFIQNMIKANSFIMWFVKGVIVFLLSFIVTTIYYYLVKETAFFERIKFMINSKRRNKKWK